MSHRRAMRVRRTVVAWTALALTGLAIAVTVTYTATRLVGEHIGLSAEPRIEGSRLVAPASNMRPVTGGPDAMPDTSRAARTVGAAAAAAAGPAAAPSATAKQPPTAREHREHGSDGEGDD